MWTAWHLLEREPDARVVLLEAGRCGHGPSGRNGGFVRRCGVSRPTLRERFGDAPARDEPSTPRPRRVATIGAWCEAQGVDAWYRAAPHLMVSRAPAQDALERARRDGEGVVALDGRRGPRALRLAAVPRRPRGARRARPCSPRGSASGCARGCSTAACAIFEHSRVRSLRGRRSRAAETAGGACAPDGGRSPSAPRRGALQPLRDRLTVSSSHIVLTEPVPDVLEALGWTGGEAITDGRTLAALLAHDAATAGSLFGWGGGRMAVGARTGGRDGGRPRGAPRDTARPRALLPGARRAAVDARLGRPDRRLPDPPAAIVSAARRPRCTRVRLHGQRRRALAPAPAASLAALALGRDRRRRALPIVDPPPKRVPPEPLRVMGAAAIRRALVAKEAAEQDGRTPSPVARALAAVPARMGMHIVR